MRKYIKPLIVAAAFSICAVVYSCGNKQDVELSLTGGAQDRSSAEQEESITVNDTGQETENETAAESDASAQSNPGDEPGTAAENTPDAAQGIVPPDQKYTIFVHVCGAVNKPDVYELDSDARVFDAIKMAGGFSEKADDDYLNLAGGIADGQKIYVPTEQEVDEGLVPAPEMNSVSVISAGDAAAGAMQGSVQESGNEDKSDKININTATADELKTLNGIGDKRAQDIIDYRNAGGSFKSIEDIKKVNGIKDGIYDKIKDDITI